MKYNVIWIDDEYKKQEAFIESASLAGISLIPFEINKDGIDKIKENPNAWDAIILDAKGYKLSKDEKPSLNGLNYSIKQLEFIDPSLPRCIFTGYLDKKEYESTKEFLDDEAIFTKGKDNDIVLSYLKSEANRRLSTQLRFEHSEVFEVLDNYSSSCQKVVLEILLQMKQSNISFNDDIYFTPIRLIIEELFRKANKLGILHDKCISKNNGRVNLTYSSHFLAGNNVDNIWVRSTKTHFPKLIANSVKSILHTTGAASHTSNDETNRNIDFQQYKREVKTPYLLFSLTYSLFDVLIWFEKYSKENSDIETNKSFWKDI